MPEIEFTNSFWESYQILPHAIQKKVKKALRLLAENPRHPSLQAKPVIGAPGIYEARIDQSYRMTYERVKGDILRIRNPRGVPRQHSRFLSTWSTLSSGPCSRKQA